MVPATRVLPQEGKAGRTGPNRPLRGPAFNPYPHWTGASADLSPMDTPPPQPKKMSRPTVSAVLDDGRMVELLFDPQRKRTSFAVWDGARWTRQTEVKAGATPLRPYAATNNLIANRVVLLPSEPAEFDTSEALYAAVQQHIHRYVDVSPRFERLSTLYVLLSWVYDRFNELPYLRLRGDFGSGKTRFLLTVGALMYKPIFASGASTISPIFHTLDAFRGTLILDEGDFRFSDEKAEIVKILNNGNVKGLPVLRTEVNRHGEFNPRAFHVFGPKLIATRGMYEDRALESRFLTEPMRGGSLRSDIPISLPDSHEEEARALRNQLLMYRFRMHGASIDTPALDDAEIEPRLRQIFAPMIALADSPSLKDELQWLAREWSTELAADRSMDMEADVLAVICDLIDDGGSNLPIKQIRSSFLERHGGEYGPITNKAMGVLVRHRLGLTTRKTQGNYAIPVSEHAKLERLCERFGVFDNDDHEEESGDQDPLF